MTETVEAPQVPVDDDPRTRGILIEAKLIDWGIRYTYEPNMPIDDIRVVETAQVRATEHLNDRDQVEEYTEQMRAGAIFPPIVLLGDSLLLDGNTRLSAAKRLRRKMIPAYLAHFPNGELGRSFAAAMNQQNGRRLTTAEAHQAAMSLLRFGHTEESVAREVGYSRQQIANWRRESEFADRASAAMVSDRVDQVPRTEQRKLADVKQNAPFAAAVELVAAAQPKAKQVTELVKAIKNAPSEAEALQVVSQRRSEWAPAGPPPHRVTVAPELAAVRRSLPQVVSNGANPMLLLEHDEERRDMAVAQWERVAEIAREVLALYRG